jgi:hypothetical protein
MQRNCHEFIAYENLIGGRGRGDRPGRGQSGPAASQAPIEQVMPLMRRALKMLSDREVTPQLGLLKSTLLQLDSTFSERTFGVSSFRDFAEKLAAAGFVTLRESGRNILVELKEDGHHPPHQHEARAPHEHRAGGHERAASPEARPDDASVEGAPVVSAAEPPRMAEAIAEVRRLFQSAPNPPRWPMYVRQVKQFLRGVDPSFDERKFGFASLNDLLRGCQKDGLFRMERDRQGVVRFFQGNVLKGPDTARPGSIDAADIAAAERLAAQAEAEMAAAEAREREAEVVEGDVVREEDAPNVLDAEEAPAVEAEAAEPARGSRRRRAPRPAAAPKAAKAPKEPREKKAARPRAAGRKKAGAAADA